MPPWPGIRLPESSAPTRRLTADSGEVSRLPCDGTHRAGGGQQGESRPFRHPAGERHQPAEQDAGTHRQGHPAERARPCLGRADPWCQPGAADSPPGCVGADIARPYHGEEPEERRPPRRVVAPQRQRRDEEEEDDAGAGEGRGPGPEPAALGACDGDGACGGGRHGCSGTECSEERADRSKARDADNTRRIRHRPAEQLAPFAPGEQRRHPRRGHEDGATEIGRAQRGRGEDRRRCHTQDEIICALARFLARHGRICHINATFGL